MLLRREKVCSTLGKCLPTSSSLFGFAKVRTRTPIHGSADFVRIAAGRLNFRVLAECVLSLAATVERICIARRFSDGKCVFELCRPGQRRYPILIIFFMCFIAFDSQYSRKVERGRNFRRGASGGKTLSTEPSKRML